MTGPNPWAAIILFSIINVYGALLISFPLRHYWDLNLFGFMFIGVSFQILVSFTLLITMFTDPGYLPKQNSEIK